MKDFFNFRKLYVWIGLVIMIMLVFVGVVSVLDKEQPISERDTKTEIVEEEIKEESEEALHEEEITKELEKTLVESKKNGIETEDTEIQYLSDQGYSLWYPENLKPKEINGYDGFWDSEESKVEIVIVPQETDRSLDDDYLKEAAGNYRVSGEYKVVTVSEVKKLISADKNIAIRMIEVVHDGDMNRFYIVRGKKQMLLITVSLKEEAVEKWKTTITNMVQTITFDE